MPLTLAKPGENVTIRRIAGKDEVRAHLAELGFVADTVVTVVSRQSDRTSKGQSGGAGRHTGQPHLYLSKEEQG